MDRQMFQLAKEILLATLAQPLPRREAHLRELCGDRADLLAEVRSLLSHQDSSSALLGDGLVPVAHSLPGHIGPYEITGVLGEGGMGVVYRGQQSVPIQREVAIKVLHAGLNTTRVLERFASERRALARMNHPNIGRILDAGSDDSGHPYVVLELIDGDPITTWCRDQEATLAQRLALMEMVCQAVQHAHDRGILHRDLKPGNVLVRSIDGRPTPCIIDFGIAKALDDTDTGTTGLELTLEGQRVGTPAYMSPEQLGGHTAAVDVRTDVYALGVIMYELLAGRRPFDDDHLSRSLRRDEPPLPSSLAKIRELRGDLDNICLMAIRPEADRRYRSAADLADDLARHRQGRPVQASPDSWRYRAGKASRRHPVLMALGLAALVFVVAGVGFLAFHARRLDAERDRALAAEGQARQEAAAAAEIATFLEGMFVDLDPLEEGPTPTTALELLNKGAERLANDLDSQPLNRGRLWAVMGRVNQNISRNGVAIEQVRRSLAAYAELADSNAVAGARAEAYETLASALHDLGRYAESESASRNALGLSSGTAPSADVTRLRLTSALATAVQAQGRLGEAQDMFQAAIGLADELGEGGASEAAYMQTMRGYILYKRGFYREALTDLTAALALTRQLRPGDNMDLVSALNNVGGMNRELGHYDEAEAFILESRNVLERIYQGRDHPAIYRAVSHLARIALARGDTAAAIAGLEEAHTQTVALLGPDNPSAWRTQDSLALAQHLRGHDDEARQTYQAALANWEEQVGPHNSRTLTCRQGYGRFLLDIGDLAAARQVLQETIDGYVADYEPGHPQLCATQVDLAEVLLREGDKAGARALLQEAVPILDRIFGGEFELCRRARGLLARSG